MKKLFFAMAAMAAMLTSCSKDDTTTAPIPQRSQVTFTVNAPELSTRAGEGNGTTATKLEYVIYDLAEAEGSNQITGTAEFENGSLETTVTVDLVEGREYEAIFFAHAPESPYTFNKTEQTMTINTTNLKANAESYDAFYKYVPEFEITDKQYSVDVEMKRPFAQLNVATIDYQNDAYPAGKMIDAATTGVKVKAYKTLNLKDGGVDDPDTFEFDLASADALKASNKITVNGVDYTWLSMNYILVNARETVDVEFSFTDEKADGTTEIYTREYSAVPVQRNHRTNIVGTILTSPTNFDVEILPGFESSINVGSFRVGEADSNEYYDDFATAVRAAIDGNKPLSLVQNAWYDADVAGAITIGADQTLTIKLNGHTLCGDADGDLAYLFEIEDGGKLIINGKVTTRGGASDTDGTISSSTGIFHVTGGNLEIYNATIKSSNIPVNVENTNEADVTIKNSTLIGGSDDDVAFKVEDGANLDKLTLDIFGAENNNVFEGDIKFGDYSVDEDGYYSVASWAEFTAALANNMTMIKLTSNIDYNNNYTIKNDVTINLNGKTLEITDPTKRINIGNKNDKNAPKPNVTIKNGNLHSKVYAQTGNVELYDIKFGGTIAYAGDAQGVITVGSANLLAERCDMAGVKAGASRPRALSTEGCSNGYLILRDCNFPSASDGTGAFVKTKLLRTYINPLSGNAKLELTNCKFGVACNIDLAASYVWSNMDLNGCSGGFTFTISSRASTSFTEVETAIMKDIKKNNSGDVRLDWADVQKMYIE